MSRHSTPWTHVGGKSSGQKIPDLIREKVTVESEKLLENLRMQHIRPPPEGVDFSYITEIYLKWFRNRLYFCAQYCCRAPNCISPSFESKFARIDYAGNNRFNLSSMRHTGQWQEIFPDLSLAECLESIRTGPHFLP